MKIIKPNSSDQLVDYNQSNRSIFLAGSIEMGLAEDWQNKVEKIFADYEKITIFNPRRDDWDSSWAQDETDPQFNHQVNWELDRLEESDIIFMYFDPNTKSPITLMELGAFKRQGNMIVCCPKGYWRRGNVQIICTRERIPFYDNIDAAIGALRTKLNQQ
jgi:hypothetical protein